MRNRERAVLAIVLVCGVGCGGGGSSDPLVGTWCAPVSGDTTRNAFTFGADGTVVDVITGTIPTSAATDPGCTVNITVNGTYVENNSSGMMTLTTTVTRSTQTLSGCQNAADNGTGPGPAMTGSQTSSPYTVTGATLNVTSGSSTLTLTRC
jgi:hypothetical protein